MVQTRFPTATLVAARVATGELDAAGLEALVGEAEDALASGLPDGLEEVEHVVYLGTGWALGIAHEAALKVRESALAWAESYPSADFRHGPLAVAGDRSLVTLLGGDPGGLAADVAVTGARVVVGERDPLAELVLAQRVALQLARLRGLDPDHPRHLTRSVVLSERRRREPADGEERDGGGAGGRVDGDRRRTAYAAPCGAARRAWRSSLRPWS